MNLGCTVLQHLLWTFVWKLYQAFQCIFWYCNGTTSRIRENYKIKSYSGSVQVLTIWARHKFCLLDQPSGADNFLTIHHSFVDPDYVLQDHVTLYYINQNEAVFVESDEGVHVTDSKHGPFIRYAQFRTAKRLIVMPMSAFHQLAETLESTKGEIVFLCSTGRCGSTLVCQAFEETGSSLVYSEPDAFGVMIGLKGVVTDQERDRIVVNCIKIFCKPLSYKEVSSYIFKIQPPCNVEMPYMMELFPRAHAIFLYRDGLACSKSLAKISRVIPSLGIMVTAGKYSGKLTKKAVEAMGFPVGPFDVKLKSALHFGAMAWCVSMKQYLDFKDSGLEIAGIRYEDIVNDTTYAFQKLFEYCHIPYNGTAVETAMGRDSQRGTTISVQNLAKYKDVIVYTKETEKLAESLCDQFGLPRFSETFIAPGTISYRDK